MHYVGPALVFVAGRELGYDRIAFAPVLQAQPDRVVRAASEAVWILLRSCMFFGKGAQVPISQLER